MDTIQSLLNQASLLLHRSDSARLDSELLMLEVLGKERSYLYSWPEQLLDKGQVKRFNELLEQREKGVPVAYLLGRQGFWSLDLTVNEHVLIPRPETELLVEKVLEHFPQESLEVADLGTGSGAVALAIASERSKWQVTAVDKSPEALQCARGNAERLQLDSVAFVESDWCAALPHSKYDLIMSNPPYIEEDDRHLLKGDVRFEPYSALVAGESGLADIKKLAQEAQNYLNLGGSLYLEHGYNQGQQVRQILADAGLKMIDSYQDLNGHERVTKGKLLSV